MALAAAAAGYVTRRGEKGGVGGATPLFRADYMFRCEQQGEYKERRRVFLRSYHFSRKQPARERVRRTLLRARRLVWTRLRDARCLPRLLWARLRAVLSGVCRGRRGRHRHAHRVAAFQFQRLPHRRSASNSSGGGSSSSDWISW